MWTVNGLYAAINLVLFIRDNLLPDAWKDRLKLLDIFHKLPWWAWAMLVLIANILLLIEGSFRAVRKREKERNDLADKLEAIEESRPTIRPKEPNAASVKDVLFTQSGIILGAKPFISVRFINDPSIPNPAAIGKQVCAKLRYFLPDKNITLLEIDGRWAESDQPSSRDYRASRFDLLRTEFNIGDEHEVDICFRDTQSGDIYAWNNDNYNYQGFRKPEHKLDGNPIHVEIRLRGPNVDQRFTFSFANSTNGLAIVTQPRAL